MLNEYEKRFLIWRAMYNQLIMKQEKQPQISAQASTQIQIDK